ncbi:hypothetical protein K458DRAFT_490482 [Lentithecium fluviatile CBS 122367]|uniref:Uncharacterized protein n=1 Tax=Lentithecium fluviatile CBS 122367 TaxID=1168545 RepID=A0A6G1INF4_9PLEO|nr:hypothetical protein K458DRAFT_490482 [Lentithecium fluviatile CBS 122367]
MVLLLSGRHLPVIRHRSGHGLCHPQRYDFHRCSHDLDHHYHHHDKHAARYHHPHARKLRESARCRPRLPHTPADGSRIKRFELDGMSDVRHPLKRQTADGNTGGYIVYPNGTYSSLYRRYPHRVDCRIVVTYDETATTVVTRTPETSVVPQQTATALTTVTARATRTVTAVAQPSTIYVACAENNVGTSRALFT